jgi:hypothetical protein
VCLSASAAKAAEFQLEENADGVTVRLDGQLFTRYLIKSGPKPILWPIVGPYGKQMTRGYPMREPSASEKKDHVHHRSLWFTHGDVNGTSFWHESDPQGTIVHREFVKLSAGERAVIQTRNDWLDPNGQRVCEDLRTFTFHADGDLRLIDVDILVTAGDERVVFGDTKEGSFAVRVAGSMRTELGQGGKIINSQGQQDGDAWGRRAEWVDYSGPVEGKTVGITIMNHPQSLRYPTYWHVRTYGLFAANPFGVRDFLQDKKADGKLVLAPRESFSLYYRVLLHPGDASSLDLPAAFQAYSQTKRQ